MGERVKRHEMVMILSEALTNLYDHALCSSKVKEKQWYANLILYKLEAEGMLPPSRKGALVGLDDKPIHAWDYE